MQIIMQYFVLKKKCSQQQIAEELGVNKATVSKWMEETARAQTKKAYEEYNVQQEFLS